MYVETIESASLYINDAVTGNILEVVCAVAGQLEKLFLCFVVFCLWLEQLTSFGMHQKREILKYCPRKCWPTPVFGVNTRAKHSTISYFIVNIHLVCKKPWTWFCCVFILAQKGKACQPLTSVWKVISEIHVLQYYQLLLKNNFGEIVMIGDLKQCHLVQEISKCSYKFGVNLASYIGSFQWNKRFLMQKIKCLSFLHVKNVSL